MTDRDILTVLKEVEGKKAQGQQIDAPRFHPFPARMPLSLANFLIENCTYPGARVLDPMCGSATTLMAAQQLGRQGIGFDRDLLACLLSRVATTSFSTSRLENLGTGVLQAAERCCSELDLPRLRAELAAEHQEFLKYWFPWRSQKELFALQRIIQEELSGSEQDLAWVVFSTLIIAKSASVSWAIDISRSRPHRDLEAEPVRPFVNWLPRFQAVIQRLPLLDVTPSTTASVQSGDARDLPLEDESVDFVLTSPPYHNAIDYLRSHKFSLVWMGHTLEDLRELRGTMLGSERGLYERDGLPDQLETRLQRLDSNRKAATLRRYLSEMKTVLRELHRVLRPEAVAMLVVGPTLLNSRRSDAAEVFEKLAGEVGFSPIGHILRTLPGHRRSLPFPTRNPEEALSKRMNREVILALRRTHHVRNS